MNRTTNNAYRAVILALLAMLVSAASLMAQDLRTAVPFDESGDAAGSQVEGEADSNDVAGQPISVGPPSVPSHAKYWEEALIHPVLRPPVVLARPAARYATWWDSIETVLGLRGGDRP